MPLETPAYRTAKAHAAIDSVLSRPVPASPLPLQAPAYKWNELTSSGRNVLCLRLSMVCSAQQETAEAADLIDVWPRIVSNIVQTQTEEGIQNRGSGMRCSPARRYMLLALADSENTEWRRAFFSVYLEIRLGRMYPKAVEMICVRHAECSVVWWTLKQNQAELTRCST